MNHNNTDHPKKRTKIRIFSFAAAGLLILSGFVVEGQVQLLKSRTELEYNYRRALNDMTDYVTNMQFVLEKSAFANSPRQRSNVSAQLLEQSSGAKASMSILPFSNERIETVNRFISQVGDYGISLSNKVNSGKNLDNKDLENLESMEKYTRVLAEALKDVQANLSTEKASVGKTQRLLNNVDEFDKIPNFDDSMDDMAKEFNDLPSLLYDGPFSDHVLQREALYIKEKETVSIKDAKNKAAKFMGLKPDELTESGTSENALASFVFTTDNSRINVSKKGGEVSFYKLAEDITESNMIYRDALKHASAFLKEVGYKSFKESYYSINDNTCTINFSYVSENEQKIICYSDLIKVVVSLDDGKVLEYNATGFIMNHAERKYEEPKLSLDEAKKNLSPLLTVQETNLAIIPTPGLNEVFCYEFLCRSKKGQDVLVYINTENGSEEKIFILTYEDNGIITH